MKKINTQLILICLFGFLTNLQAQQGTCPISGPSKIYDENIYSYSSNNDPFSSYSWSVTGDLEIVSGSNTSTLRVRKKRNASSITGEVCVLRFRSFNSYCRECKEVKLGCLRSASITQTAGSCFSSGDYKFRIDTSLEPDIIPIVNFSWSVNNATIIGPRNGRYVTIRPLTSTPIFTVNVSVTSCGSRLTRSKTIFCGFGVPDCGPVPCVTLSPNPVSGDAVTINLDKSNFQSSAKNIELDNLASTAKAAIEILDENGRLVKTLETDQLDTSISVQDLKKGLYFVKIRNAKGETFTKRLVRN